MFFLDFGRIKITFFLLEGVIILGLNESISVTLEDLQAPPVKITKHTWKVTVKTSDAMIIGSKNVSMCLNTFIDTTELWLLKEIRNA